MFFSVLGVFDPLVRGVGGPKVDRIFFSILDDYGEVRWSLAGTVSPEVPIETLSLNIDIT